MFLVGDPDLNLSFVTTGKGVATQSITFLYKRNTHSLELKPSFPQTAIVMFCHVVDGSESKEETTLLYIKSILGE